MAEQVGWFRVDGGVVVSDDIVVMPATNGITKCPLEFVWYGDIEDVESYRRDLSFPSSCQYRKPGQCATSIWPYTSGPRGIRVQFPVDQTIAGVPGTQLFAFIGVEPTNIQRLDWIGADAPKGANIRDAYFLAGESSVIYPTAYDGLRASHLSGVFGCGLIDGNGLQWELLRADPQTSIGVNVDQLDRPKALIISSRTGRFPRQAPELWIEGGEQPGCLDPFESRFLDQDATGMTPIRTRVFTFVDTSGASAVTWPPQYFQWVPYRINQSFGASYVADACSCSHKYCARDAMPGQILRFEVVLQNFWAIGYEVIGETLQFFNAIELDGPNNIQSPFFKVRVTCQEYLSGRKYYNLAFQNLQMILPRNVLFFVEQNGPQGTTEDITFVVLCLVRSNNETTIELASDLFSIQGVNYFGGFGPSYFVPNQAQLICEFYGAVGETRFPGQEGKYGWSICRIEPIARIDGSTMFQRPSNADVLDARVTVTAEIVNT